VGASSIDIAHEDNPYKAMLRWQQAKRAERADGDKS
jgi:hypothetical protein